MYSATYSPDDNKLRLYASSRLDADTYAKVKAAGFRWAPKQDLFVAPAWSPQREDLLLELAGEIDDDDQSLTERAAERAERFEGYKENRAADAESARAAVSRVADNIPFGQPILVGHHSERHARKDAERIENGMRKAVKMWKTSEYWSGRAAGAIAHAKYKELPAVRARRIKTLEAEQRKVERSKANAEKAIRIWSNVHEDGSIRRKSGEPMTFLERVTFLAGHTNTAPFGVYMDLTSDPPKITPDEAWARTMAAGRSSLAHCARWLGHLANRLTYERALLAESGYAPPPKPKTSAALPLLNYAGPVAYRNPWHKGEIIRGEAVGVTKAELAAIGSDYKATRVSECGTHRVRTAMLRRPGAGRHGTSIVYLTDSKQHPKPGAEVVATQAAEELAARDRILAARSTAAVTRFVQGHPEIAVANVASFEAMAASLKAGVQVVSAPQLFPTPNDLAHRMVGLADIQPGHRVLEPSAGTGALLGAMGGRMFGHNPERGEVVAVEINRALSDRFAHSFPLTRVVTADFLGTNGDLGTFDRIVMNPPFERGGDIKHITHALRLLRPGGRLVALCANGPRQQAQLQPIADSWEDLPAGTFDGTGVRAALATFTAG